MCVRVRVRVRDRSDPKILEHRNSVRYSVIVFVRAIRAFLSPSLCVYVWIYMQSVCLVYMLSYSIATAAAAALVAIERERDEAKDILLRYEHPLTYRKEEKNMRMKRTSE